MSDAKLLSDLRNPKWSRFKDTGALAASRIEALSHEAAYWKDLWKKAATRVLQLEPNVKVIAEIKPRKPDPWQDV
jgi:hypothetical protein